MANGGLDAKGCGAMLQFLLQQKTLQDNGQAYSHIFAASQWSIQQALDVIINYLKNGLHNVGLDAETTPANRGPGVNQQPTYSGA